MIEERLRFRMMIGNSEYLGKQLLHDLPMRVLCKVLVKGEKWSGGAETVSGHLQLSHSVNILYLK